MATAKRVMRGNGKAGEVRDGRRRDATSEANSSNIEENKAAATKRRKRTLWALEVHETRELFSYARVTGAVQRAKKSLVLSFERLFLT
jgi:hypothetical protein